MNKISFLAIDMNGDAKIYKRRPQGHVGPVYRLVVKIPVPVTPTDIVIELPDVIASVEEEVSGS